jgi:hypothetical protein
MANDFQTIATMLADALDLAPHELSEIKDAAPLISRLPVIPSSNGDTHKYAVNTQNPVVGFRAENAGRDFDKSVHRIDTVTLKILDFSWAVDKAVADRWRQGGASAYIAREGLFHLRAAMYAMENQYINGTVDASSAGFAGLADSTNLDALADAMVVNAGNASADTGASCYLLRVSPSECATVAQGDGISLGSTIVQNFVDGSNLNLPVYYTPATTWVAGQIGSLYSSARICNLKDDDTNGLTDDLLYSAMKLFPAGMGPNLVVTNQTQLERLRRSRTATNGTGAPAPTPSSTGNGVAIITSDALIHTEALIA